MPISGHPVDRSPSAHDNFCTATPVSDLLAFAAGQGHRDFPCLSRTHAPSSCVPCADFSPWLRERVRRRDVEGGRPSISSACGRRIPAWATAPSSCARTTRRLADRITHRAARPLPDAAATRRPTSTCGWPWCCWRCTRASPGFIMTGEAADFIASVMAPHRLAGLRRPAELVDARNQFVLEMAKEMSYWAAWPMLAPDSLRSLGPPEDPALAAPARCAPHAAARRPRPRRRRHPPPERPSPRPKTLASLSRYETRKRGLDVAVSSRLILESGIVVPATDLDGWLGTWTRRDLLGLPGAERGGRAQLVGEGAAGRGGEDANAPTCCGREWRTPASSSWPPNTRGRHGCCASTWRPPASAGGSGSPSGPGSAERAQISPPRRSRPI